MTENKRNRTFIHQDDITHLDIISGTNKTSFNSAGVLNVEKHFHELINRLLMHSISCSLKETGDFAF
jgi:hypothetical protein